MTRVGVFIVAVFLALLPSAGYAQVNLVSGEGFVMRINGDLTVQEGETVDSAVIIDGNSQVDGTVEDFLLIIDGTSEVTGRVNGDIFGISADINLAEGAVVTGDINLIESDLQRAPGSEVRGNIDEDFDLEWWEWILINFVLWIGMTIAVIIFGLLLVAVAPRQAANAAALMRSDVGWSVLSAAITFIGVPVLAVIALITVVGIPLGLGVLIFALPAVWFVGYLIAGLMLGTLIYSRTREGVRDNPYLAVVTGLGIIQLVVLVPFVGFVVAVLMGFWGAGALMLLAWRSFRSPRGASPLPA
jgi:hypothetical protein